MYADFNETEGATDGKFSLNHMMYADFNKTEVIEKTKILIRSGKADRGG